jgi:hypothetical protein
MPQSLFYALACFAKDMAPGCVPIGENLLGDQICIAALGARRGKIHFWDHEVDYDAGSSPTTEKLPIIANSFEDFINGLYTKTDAGG